MTIFILLKGMAPQDVFHSLQRAKKSAKQRGLLANARIVEVEVTAGLFFPLFKLVTTYTYKNNWVRNQKSL